MTLGKRSHGAAPGELLVPGMPRAGTQELGKCLPSFPSALDKNLTTRSLAHGREVTLFC